MSARGSPTGWYRANCPFCETLLGKADRKACFAIRPDSGHYGCFRCGTKGRLRVAGADDAPYEKPAQPEAIPQIQPPEDFTLLAEGPGLTADSLKPARKYLLKRGLTRELAAEARIGGCATGYYGGRVVVPVLSPEGEWWGWVARAWVKQAEVPYLYPRGMARGRTLYNHAALHVETDVPLLVVEGVFDALAYWPDAVAVLGKPSEDQFYALAAARRPVCVVLDGDAWDEGWTFAMKLRLEGQRAGAVRLGPRIDPDEVDKGWLRDEARRSVEAL